MVEPHDREARTAGEADAVAALFQAAGRREGPPPETYARTLAAATATWEAKVRRRRRRLWLSAVAASIVILAGGLLTLRTLGPSTHGVVGHTDLIAGAMEVQSSTGVWTAVSGQAAELRVRDRVRTNQGSRAGILLANGASIRLADATEIVFESSARVRVVTGKLYLDTGIDIGSTASPLEIVTPLAIARDVGTQFEVLYRGNEYRLRVREGRVQVRHDSGFIESDAGEQLSIGTGGVIERTRVRSDDAEWAWAQEVAPRPQIDGRTVSVLLEWVARETGKSIRFETAEAERKARTTILHGSVGALAPLDTLSVMLATTDLEHVLTEDDTILIRLKNDR